MNNLPAAKIKMMRDSIRCLTFGLLGLLPAIGLPFAIAALVIAGKARVRERELWNAAKPYRLLGTLCGILGAVVWPLLAGLMTLRLILNSCCGQ